MSTSDLTPQRLRELLDYDRNTGVFTRRHGPRRSSAKPGDVAGCLTPAGYVAISVDGRKHQAHRLVWMYEHGRWPVELVDHRDGNRSNNSLGNLREASHQGNHQNLRRAHADNLTGYLGVTFDKRRGLWKSHIHAEGKLHWLGRFKTPELAHAAYLTAKRNLHSFCTI